MIPTWVWIVGCFAMWMGGYTMGRAGLSKLPRLERCSQCKYVGILDNHIRPKSQTCPNTDGFANREEV
jgi:hypothetical protein